MKSSIRLSNFSPRTLKTLVIVFACILALALGYYFARYGFQVRELAIFGIGIAGLLLVLLSSERVLQVGFGLWVLTFGLGWRTIYLTSNLNIHPSEVLAWLLFVLLLAKNVTQRIKLDFTIPLWVPALIVFASFGFLVALANGMAVDIAVSEFKVILVILPVYYIVKWLIRDAKGWERTANLAAGVGVYLGGLGMLDAFAPGLASRLSAVPESHVTLGSLQGFDRVLFSIFGAPLAGAVILTLMGFTLPQLFRRHSTVGIRILVAGALAIQVYGIYVSGYRVTTFGMLLLFALYALFERRALILLVALAAVIPFLPTAFLHRVLSLFDERYADTSQVKRVDRAEEGLQQVWSSPLWGHGWGGSGYVHSDLIQLAGNLGLPALFVFLGWFGTTLFSLWQLTRQRGFFREYGAALFAGVAAVLLPLAGEGLIPFIQLMIPVWFLLSMAHRLTELACVELVAVSELDG